MPRNKNTKKRESKNKKRAYVAPKIEHVEKLFEVGTICPPNVSPWQGC